MFKIDPNYPVLRESNISGLKFLRRGKVRDIYTFEEYGRTLCLVTTDRISTHDVVYEDCIPHKGYGLVQTSVFAFKNTEDIVPNHLLDCPDPNVMIVRRCEEYPVEVIVRGILTGSAWREYQKSGEVCGIKLPKGMRKNQMLEEPIVTPSTKAATGHDVNIASQRARDVIGPVWDEISDIAVKLYNRGNEMASQRKAILVDTKFEFGHIPGTDIMLIDEILDHDSSRYVDRDNYEESFRQGIDPIWIDKQFVRDYSEAHGFRGEGKAPRLPDEIKTGASERVLRVYELLSGKELGLPPEPPTDERIRKNLLDTGLI